MRNNLTKAEAILWREIKGKKILGCKFRRQFSIYGFVVDFYSPEINLAIEIDGFTHSTKAEIEYDSSRQNDIENLGIQFIRFTNFEIYENLADVLEEISKLIKNLRDSKTTPSRLWRSTPPS